MTILEGIFLVAAVMWGSLFLYLAWLNRKVASLMRELAALRRRND